jgi:hypothetical protein
MPAVQTATRPAAIVGGSRGEVRAADAEIIQTKGRRLTNPGASLDTAVTYSPGQKAR